jgi:hypothetical protein
LYTYLYNNKSHGRASIGPGIWALTSLLLHARYDDHAPKTRVALRQSSDANTGQVTQVNLVIYDMPMVVEHIAVGGYPQGGWQGS